VLLSQRVQRRNSSGVICIDSRQLRVTYLLYTDMIKCCLLFTFLNVQYAVFMFFTRWITFCCKSQVCNDEVHDEDTRNGIFLILRCL